MNSSIETGQSSRLYEFNVVKKPISLSCVGIEKTMTYGETMSNSFKMLGSCIIYKRRKYAIGSDTARKLGNFRDNFVVYTRDAGAYF